VTWLTNPYRFGAGPTPALSSVDWAVQFLSSRDDGKINNIQMASSNGGANLCTGGQGRERRTTGNNTDVYANNNGAFTSIPRNASLDDFFDFCYTFPAAQVIREIKVQAQTGSLGTPLSGLVKVSYDNRATFVPVYLFSTPDTWTNSEIRTFQFDPQVWLAGTGRNFARGWRIVINDWVSFNQPYIGNLIFAGTAGGPTLCTGGAVISHRTYVGDPNLAFDGNISTFWQGTQIRLLGQRLGYGFTTPVNVAEVRLQATSADFAGTPSAFDVQWTNDFYNWTTALSVSGSTGWTSGETRSWTIP
jgi:hypothetical protein